MEIRTSIDLARHGYVRRLLTTALGGCVAGCVANQSPQGPAVNITPTVVHGEVISVQFELRDVRPYVGEQDPALPPHERMRLAMRRYAGERLVELGYCPKGFVGPDRVLVPERSDRRTVWFRVDCIR